MEEVLVLTGALVQVLCVHLMGVRLSEAVLGRTGQEPAPRYSLHWQIQMARLENRFWRVVAGLVLAVALVAML